MNELQTMPTQENPATAQMSPPMLLERAIQSDVTPEVLEKLMGLQERWQAAQAKAAFNKAMADMRQTLPPIVKNQKVDFSTNKGRTHYQYEDLNDVTEVLTPHLARFGLAFRWRTQPGDPVTVTCIVSHRDGHTEESSLSAPRDESGNKNAIQGLGSAITYLQRYTLKAALGVAAARDDDGQAAGQPKVKPADRFYHEAAKPADVAQPTVPTEKNAKSAAWKKWTLWQLHKWFTDEQLGLFAGSSGPLEEWPDDKFPTKESGYIAFANRIEEFLESLSGIAPAQEPAEFGEWFWDEKITLPHAKQKRADYLGHEDTIKSLYVAAKGGDEKAGQRLHGIAHEWMPAEWSGNDGKMRPPSAADVQCRKALDAYLEWREQRKENDHE